MVNAVFNSSGKLNGALEFDGDGDYVNASNPSFISDTNGSVSLWIRVNFLPNSMHPISASDEIGDNDFFVPFQIRSNGQIRTLTSVNGIQDNVQTSSSIMINKWYHLVSTTNGSAWKIYINGVEETSLTVIAGSNTGEWFGDVTAIDNFLIGIVKRSSFTGSFNGSIDEIAIWNRTLSASEISRIYQRQKGNYGLGNYGNYTSKIFNAEGNAVWDNVSWRSNAIGELPANQKVETNFGSGNANMTGNVLLMHFNEGSGIIKDSSGNGNNGTENGGIIYDATGKFNSALIFDGVNDYVDMGDVLDPLANDFTVSAWIKLDDYVAYNVIVGKSDGSNNGFIALIEKTTGKLRARLGNIAGNLGTATVPIGMWTHVVFEYNRSGSVVGYINGIQVGGLSISGQSYSIDVPESLKIGETSSTYFGGAIDEVAIWNRSLSAQEILDIYKRGVIRLNLSVRSCDDENCSGESFIDINNSSPQNLSVISNQYFQYKFDFETDDSLFTPELYNFTINYNRAPDVPISNSPVNESKVSNTFVLLNTSISDLEGDNLTVWFYGDGSIINTTSMSNESFAVYNWTSLSESLHNWSVVVGDGNLNSSSEVYFFNVDVSAPSIILVHPKNNQSFTTNESISISLNITDVSPIDTIIANVTLENGTVIQLSNFSYGLQSDNFNGNSLGVNWAKTNITSGSQVCIVDINETIPSKMFISVNGSGGTTSAQCGVNSVKKMDGNFDVNISFNLTSFEDDTLFSFRSNSLDSFLPAGVRVFTDIERSSGVSKYTLGYNNGTVTTQESVTTTDTYGKFRIKRFNTTGTPVFNLYYFNNSGQEWINLLGNISLPGSHMSQYIQIKPSSTASNYGVLNITLENFSVNSDNFIFDIFEETTYSGRYNVSIFVNDSFGFANDSERGYFLTEVSNHAPSRPFLTNPNPNTAVRDMVSIPWSTVLDQDGDNFQFNISLLNSDGSFNSSIVSNYGDTSSTSYLWNTSLFAEGLYGLEIKVFENETAAGLSNIETLAGNITIDNSVPDDPILNSPLNNSNVSASNVLLNATLSNPDGRVMTVWFYGDEILLDTLSGIVSGSSITYYWTGLAEGFHNWSVVGYDGVYNSSIITSFFTVDTLKPVVNLVSPLYNSVESASNTIEFIYNVSDVTTNISNCSLYVDGNFKEVNLSIEELVNNSFSAYLYKKYYNWSVKCYDSAGNFNESDLYYLNVSLQAPTVNLTSPVSNYSLTSDIVFNCSATDDLNLVNMTLYGNWSGGWHANETKSLNGTNDFVIFNKTISDGSYAWNCLAYDNNGLSDYYFENFNKTLTIDTSIPSIIINSPASIESISRLEKVLNVTISEVGNIWYNLNSLGNESLCSNCVNGNVVLNFTDYGSQSIVVYVNDALGNVNNSSLNFVLNLDTDGDGTIDSLDSDDDNDGIADMSDNLNGNLSNIFSNIVGFNLSVNGSFNLGQQFIGLLRVNFTNGTEDLIDFYYNFSAGQVLNLGEVIVREQEGNLAGSLLVKGVSLATGQTKTVYVDNLNSNLGNVCIKDSEIGLISEVSSDCSGSGEVRVSCDGTVQFGFNCTDLGSRYMVSGLSHSGVIEIGNASVVVSTGGGSSGGGGSGGGSGCVYNESFDWECSGWGECVGGVQIRDCKEFNNCGSGFGRPVVLKNCVVDVVKEDEKKEVGVNLQSRNDFNELKDIKEEKMFITGNVIEWIGGGDKWYSLIGIFFLIFAGGLYFNHLKIKNNDLKIKKKEKLTLEGFHKKIKADVFSEQQKLKKIEEKKKQEKKRIIFSRKKLRELENIKKIKAELRDSKRKLNEKILKIQSGKIDKK